MGRVSLRVREIPGPCRGVRAVFKLAILFLRLAVPVSSGEIVPPPRLCDDGSSPHHSNGAPNWACFIDGCSPSAEVCWEDRTAGCFDEEGEENGSCVLTKQTCKSKLACFDMWLGCAGTYRCLEDSSWIGCTDGVCELPADPSSYSAAADPSCPRDLAHEPAHSRAPVTSQGEAANPWSAA